jgi:hypothetical protein
VVRLARAPRRCARPGQALYIREVKPPDTWRGRLAAVHNRELHAERDTEAHRFQHVDGKVCR